MLQKNSLNIFLIFIVFHLSIWTLIPSLSNINLPLDTIEHLAWSTNISLGYSKHPPMIAVVLNFFIFLKVMTGHIIFLVNYSL